MKHQEIVMIVDFGGQYAQLIARRVRECGVYCEILPYNKSAKEILAQQPKGIIFSGGPSSVNAENAPEIDPDVFKAGVPILGICYGMQLMAKTLGGEVSKPEKHEYGHTDFYRNGSSALFEGVSEKTAVWMSHGDAVTDCDRRENHRCTASHGNAHLNGIDDLVDVHVSRYDLVVGGDDADQRTLHLFLGHSQCVEQGTLGCFVHTLTVKITAHFFHLI